jgi:hypothetical protein
MALVEHGPSGRWGGKLTRRPLPEVDPSIDALSPADRERLAAIWITRTAMERRVADSFEIIKGALERRGADASLVDLATRAIDDEYRHTELSRVVASRFAGRELPSPERLVLEPPKHKGASPELRDTLFIVGHCLLNETTASVFLEVCLSHAKGALAKAALAELLSDEIDHGRIGWAHLAAASEATRAEVARWLLPMSYLNLRIWKSETPEDPEHSEALTHHGAPPSRVLHEALAESMNALVVPGLEQLGIHTAPLRAWLDAGAFTDRPPTELADL